MKEFKFFRKGDGAKVTVLDPCQADAFRRNPDWEPVVEKRAVERPAQPVAEEQAQEPVKKATRRAVKR